MLGLLMDASRITHYRRFAFFLLLFLSTRI